MPNHKSALHHQLILLTAILVLSGTSKSYAYDPSYYAQSSKLSSGQWAKIEVIESGIQFISDATLKTLGFNEPDKVNVFGYGGVVIPETLLSPDDLPIVPSMRVEGGIVFFGNNSVGWESNYNTAKVHYHLSHPYSDNSFYFISDCLDRRITPVEAMPLTQSNSVITEFTERILHEQDLMMPLNTGRLMLGEDFKTSPSRNFRFELPGNKGNAKVTTAFGCKTSSGTSTLSFTANGTQLSANNSDRIASSDSKMIVTTTTTKLVENPGNLLDLTIKYQGGSNVTIANLDYIEVEYPRSLDLSGGDLYFYLSPLIPSKVKIEGAGASTMVWDVTDRINPEIVPTELDGTTLTFITDTGYHEYVAFEHSKVSRNVIPGVRINNQDIHAMPSPDMVIISPTEYLYAARNLAELRRRTDGLDIVVLTPEEIYNEFSSGKPDVSAFRKMLKMWYDRAQGEEGKYPAYCLIMSRPTYDNKMVTSVVRNAGYPRVPIWQSATGDSEATSYSTDDYIGMLEDVKGEFNIGNAVINVAVARMPVRSLAEANAAVEKLENYLVNPDFGSWRNNIMFIADDQNSGVHLDQAESVINEMRSSDYGKRFQYEKLYLDAYQLEYTGVGATYPQARERLLNKWNEGVAFIDYIGHANPKAWTHESILTWPDITAMSNKRLPFLYAATCEFLRWDDDDISGGEFLWHLPTSGVIGMICPSREVLISANGVLNLNTAKSFFERDEKGLPISVGEIMRRGKNESNTGSNKLRYGLIGDPSLRLPWPVLTVKVDSINGIDIETSDDLPVLQARSNVKVSGHIEDEEGNILNDFNGIAELSLFDAEKVITTNGNGSDGVVSVYNDRKTRLFVGRMKVVDGVWSTDFTMPSEIENNYSPALLSLYAYDEGGREANGFTEQVYAYGYDEEAPDDFEGPKIIELYLDHPNFVSGSQVSPSPTLYAKFYDESGISVSEAGIGHNITLELDGKSFFDDVAQYYLPDEEDSGAGSLTYGFTNLTQGDHTLRFTVWDNANNSTTANINFSISALWKPSIEILSTDVNPATTNVNFIVATDGSTSSMECAIEIYDLWGKKVWRGQAPALSGSSPRTSIGWDLCDFAGARVPGGIYLYRATVKTDSGATVTKTKKLVVTAQ